MSLRWLVVCVGALLACAESGTLLDSAAADADDAQGDVSDASDVDFDVPRFDLPPPRDAVEDEAGFDAPAELSEVSADAAPARVDHCYLLDARTLDLAPGAMSAPLGVAVFVAGVTAGAGQGAGVAVEVGVGPGGSNPLASAWTWSAATYDRDVDGRGATGARDYDRHQGNITASTTAGEYAWAARARVGTGPWTACDFVQTTPHEYSAAFAGRLSVAAVDARRVTYCNLQFPRTLSVTAGASSAMPVYGRVYANMLTNRGCADMPAATELGAQLGHGPTGSVPSTATWTWVDGGYSAHRDSTNPLIEGNCANLEYRATPRAPTDCARRDYGWRFRVGSGPWTYCRWAPPAEGAPSAPPFDVWEPALAGAMSVTGCP